MSDTSFLSVPELDAPSWLQADWLELVAFFSKNNEAFLSELVDQQDLEWESEPDDFGDADALLEDIASKVTSEVERRSYVLQDAYPFTLNKDGRVLCLEKNWSVGQSIYIFCLILSHASPSELVPKSYAPHDEELREARDLFQVCATLAAAGHTRGPSFSIGWPRVDRSTFLSKLQEIWSLYRDGVPHDEPPVGTPGQHKDEGIDVISYWPERDGLPGVGYLIGQAASGHDWPSKSVRPALRALQRWFKHQPVSDGHPAIFIPFSITDDAFLRDTSIQGYVAHRLRLPGLAGKAPGLSHEGIAPIERLEEVGRIQEWLARHRQGILGNLGS